MYSSYTPFTRPLHATFTPLTPLTSLVQASYTITCIVLTRLLHVSYASYTPLTRRLHNYMYSSFTRLLHACYTPLTRLLHNYMYTSYTPLLTRLLHAARA
jgi:hypothetical protein